MSARWPPGTFYIQLSRLVEGALQDPMADGIWDSEPAVAMQRKLAHNFSIRLPG